MVFFDIGKRKIAVKNCAFYALSLRSPDGRESLKFDFAKASSQDPPLDKQVPSLNLLVVIKEAFKNNKLKGFWAILV